MSPAAIITGSGITEHFHLGEKTIVETEYGQAVVFKSNEGVFILPRHGLGHTVPPHAINYRANVAALRQLDVRNVFATNAVGSMNRSFRVGQIGLIKQFLDFTKSRPNTFFEDEVVHTDMTDPYSDRLNRIALRAAKRLGIKLRDDLVYVCVEGPRYETAAEIRMFRKMGGDVVGMTGVPEVVLAREIGLEYFAIAVATNWAAGIQRKVSHEEVIKVMKTAGGLVKDLLVEMVNLL